MKKDIQLDDIRLDKALQPREQIDEATVAEYAEAMQETDEFPAVDVFLDGSNYWLADGYHRYHAAKRCGFKTIAANVHEGDKRKAILFAVAANKRNGLRRTNDDKRRAVMTLLTDSEWGKWSDRAIADRVGVSHNFVGDVRHQLSSDDSCGTKRVGKDGKERAVPTPKQQRETTVEVVDTETGEVLDNAEVVRTTVSKTAPAATETSNAMDLAGQAINALEQISADDPRRTDALEAVADWIESNQ